MEMIFVLDCSGSMRGKPIAKAKEAVTYDNFNSLDELKLKVMQSLLFWQQNQSKMGGIGI